MVGFMLADAYWQGGISWCRSGRDKLIHFDYTPKSTQ
jgi:hypothetical protein